METQTEQESLNWISATLLNDEFSTDEEMINYFIENGLSKEESIYYVNQRNNALSNPLSFELISFGFKLNWTNKENALKEIKKQEIFKELNIKEYD
jgi:hypothetical protein